MTIFDLIDEAALSIIDSINEILYKTMRMKRFPVDANYIKLHIRCRTFISDFYSTQVIEYFHDDILLLRTRLTFDPGSNTYRIEGAN